MYSFFSGKVVETDISMAVIDVSGVGYELQCSSRTLSMLKKGEQALLYAYLHLSQDALALYGFSSKEERSMFLRLISVSRVGPKVALSALSAMTPADVAAAIVTGNDVMLSRVPGLGKKTAQRIILELQEKIASEEAIGFTPMTAEGGAGNDVIKEAAAALVAPGYDNATAIRAVSKAEQSDRVEDVIKSALKQLAK